mgnify:FL=1
MKVNFAVNGKKYVLDLPSEKRLIDILREDLHLTGTKEGCGEGECGACTVIMDNAAIHSCLILACQLEGKEIITIEGLAKEDDPDPLQKAFVEELAVQCGYCTSGMIMSAKALLLQNPNATEREIRVALSGNICRCSGYGQIVKAVKRAQQEMLQKSR